LEGADQFLAEAQVNQENKETTSNPSLDEAHEADEVGPIGLVESQRTDKAGLPDAGLAESAGAGLIPQQRGNQPIFNASGATET
jgi:hypothetical protein